MLNKIVERELEKTKEQLKKKLITSHKRVAKNQKTKKEMAI